MKYMKMFKEMKELAHEAGYETLDDWSKYNYSKFYKATKKYTEGSTKTELKNVLAQIDKKLEELGVIIETIH